MNWTAWIPLAGMVMAATITSTVAIRVAHRTKNRFGDISLSIALLLSSDGFWGNSRPPTLVTRAIMVMTVGVFGWMTKGLRSRNRDANTGVFHYQPGVRASDLTAFTIAALNTELRADELTELQREGLTLSRRRRRGET